MADGKAKAREIVEAAYSLVAYYAQSVQTGVRTEAQVKQEAVQALENLRYAGDGCIRVNDMRPRVVDLDPAR